MIISGVGPGVGVTVNIYSMITSLLALTSLVVALIIERDEHFPARPWILLSLIANGVFVGAQALEYSSPSLGMMIFWDRFQYLGLMLLPGAYLLSVLDVMGRKFCINYKTIDIIGLGAAGILFLAASDAWLHWLIEDYKLFSVGKDVFLAKKFAWGSIYVLVYGLAGLQPVVEVSYGTSNTSRQHIAATAGCY